MANIISDETIEYVGILAKLELSDDEKEKAKLGECYTIAGLKITPVAWNGAALFQKTDHLTISNLNLKDPDISCQGQNTAGLVAQAGT